MREVARHLQSVSKEFRISDATCQAILDVAEKLNYRPNILAQSLRLRKSMTVGLIVYCMIDVAFESAVPRLVRERSAGIHKRLGGTPLPGWILLAAKGLSAGLIVLVEVALVLLVGLISSDVAVMGSRWLLGFILLLGTSITAAMAAIVSNVTSSADGAVVAVHVIYIPMLFLCGAFIPVDLAILTAWTIAGWIVAIRTFHWE